MLQAVKVLNRHLAAGSDGFNDDFYKSTLAIMVTILVTISNEIRTGAATHPLFLEALVNSLRK